MEVILPIPTDIEKKNQISNYVKDIIQGKIDIRKKIAELTIDFDEK